MDEEGADRIRDRKAMYGMPKNSGDPEPPQAPFKKKTPEEREASIRRHCKDPRHLKSQFCQDWIASKG